MFSTKKISTIAGIGIILGFILIIFGGVFAYKNYLTSKKIQQPEYSTMSKKVVDKNLSTTTLNNPSVTTLSYENSQDLKYSSEHIYPEITTIKGSDERDDRPFSKEIILPKLRNINDKNVLDNINELLSFLNITGCKGLYDPSCKIITLSSNLTGVDYKINYDKNGILSLSFFTYFVGAYPSGSEMNYSINLTNGNPIQSSDIFYKNKVDDLINFLNNELDSNVRLKLEYEKRG